LRVLPVAIVPGDTLAWLGADGPASQGFPLVHRTQITFARDGGAATISRRLAFKLNSLSKYR
jgi:hypothetical protein